MKKTISIIICVIMIVAVSVTALAATEDDLLTVGATGGETQVGDINGDGELNNKDVVLLFRYVSGSEKADDETVYDFNGDGNVDNKDVVSLFRIVSGSSSTEEPESSEPEPESSEPEPESSEDEPEESDPEPEPEDPIPDGAVQIGSRDDLFEFADNVLTKAEDYKDKTIVLTADIDLDPSLDGGKNWTPLSTDALSGATIDGRGHTISNMTITQDDLKTAYGMGFIGISRTSLTIKNIIFKNANLTSTSKHVGCVIGSTEASGSNVTIENVTVTDSEINGYPGIDGDLTGISFRVGGIIGANTEGGGCNVLVTGCKVENTVVQGFHNICGIVGCTTQAGNVRNTEIEDCSVKNVTLKYSARYSGSYKDNPEAARYFADIFYSVNDHWSEYHTDIDVNNHGNTYENIEVYDIVSGVTYKDLEGKSADYEGAFPASTNVTRPPEQRPQ